VEAVAVTEVPDAGGPGGFQRDFALSDSATSEVPTLPLVREASDLVSACAARTLTRKGRENRRVGVFINVLLCNYIILRVKGNKKFRFPV
jgi:hypothetical protein